MATNISFRSLLSKLPTTIKPLAFLLSRSFSSAPIAPLLTNPTSSHPLFLLRCLRPLAASSSPHLKRSFLGIRSLFSRDFSPLEEENPKLLPLPMMKSLPPRCDLEHWLIGMHDPDPNSTRDEIIDTYVETLALVIGSVQLARMKIYSVSTVHCYSFGAHVPKHIALRIAELPNVDVVIHEEYYDVANKLYGGEPFINGQAVPFHPKYHKWQIRDTAQNYECSGRNDQGPPKMGASEWNTHYCRSHFDRSGNYEIGGGNLYPVLPPNVPQNYKGDNLWRTRFYYLPHMPSGGMLYRLPPNMGGVPQRNYGGMPPPNNTGMTQMQAGQVTRPGICSRIAKMQTQFQNS